MRYAGIESHLTTRQHPDTNELMDLKILKAVNQLLLAKGFVELKDKPDFYLHYAAQVRRTPRLAPLAILCQPTGWATARRWLLLPG